VIVVDTNVVAYLYLESARTAAAERLLQRDAEWAAPALWRSEFRSVLAAQMARRALNLDQATALQAEAEDLLGQNEYEVQSRAVLELAFRSGCSAYDCEFVALAQALEVRLVTADEQILKAFPRIAVRL
jgi:predicted nucleic acid-binding protein